VDNIMVNVAVRNDWKWAVFSPEHDVLYHVQRLAEIYVGSPFYTTQVGAMTQGDMEAARMFIDEHFLWIGDDETEATMPTLLRLIEDAVMRHKCTGVVIDPWNYIVNTQDSRMSETNQVAVILRELVRFARRTECHIVLVAHPRKVDRRSDGDYEDISLYSISGSAHFFNMVQNGIVLMRKGLLTLPPEQQTTIVRVDKVKYKYVGRTGQVEMFFDNFSSRFVEDKSSISRNLTNIFPEHTDNQGAPVW
jgi:twinkle protein